MTQVIVLRPEPAASRTAEKARAMGLKVRIYPLFAPKALAWTPPPPEAFDALLLTSGNGVRMAGEALAKYRSLPAYAVGVATARALAEAGFPDIVAGQSNGTAIAKTMIADGRKRVLHLAGAAVAEMDAGPLHVARVAVYRMVATPPDPTLMDIARPGSVMLVHSPRAGERLAMQIRPEKRVGLHVVAISAAAAHACATGWASVLHPPLPRDDEMLALARRLCE